MKLIVSGLGHVTWDNTRSVVITSAKYRAGQADFGVGNENTALCPGCGRTLPTVCMHLDHILPQARHAISIVTTPLTVTLLDHTYPHNVSTRFAAVVSGGTISIHKLGEQNPTKRQRAMSASGGSFSVIRDLVTTLHTRVAWENDLENLQFLCMMCNTAKGARDFDAHFAGRATRPLET